MRRRGSALIVVLATVAVVTSLGVVATDALVRSVAAARTAEQRAVARAAAEGGVEAARAALGADPAWSGTSLDVEGTTVQVRVTPADDGDVVVHSVARTAAGASAAIEARVRLRGGRLPSIASWRE